MDVPTIPPPGVDGGYLAAGLWRIDLALAWRYPLGRAWRISLRERPRRGRRAFTYGQTPLSTMRRVLTLASAQQGQTFLELGSGTGRFCMVAARLLGMRAVGVELLPSFVRSAASIAAAQQLPCRFVQADLFDVSWSQADLLYLTATTFSDALMARVSDKCGELKPGACLVSLTRPPTASGLVQEAMEVLDFSWGPGTVFVHRRTLTAPQRTPR